MKNNISGLLLVNKPIGPTSFKITNKISKILKAKAGHAGTLDPFAEGLMLIAINKATRLLEYFSNLDKEYFFTTKWNEETDTLDNEGKIIKTCENKINFDQIPKALSKFIGNIDQVPPLYSAIKHQGKPLYKYARSGKIIEPKSRKTTIYEFENIANNIADNSSQFRILCSKGTYIRSISRDLAYSINNVAYTTYLKRTKIGNYNQEDALEFSEIDELNIENLIKKTAFIPLNKIRISKKSLNLTREEYDDFIMGKKIQRNDLHFSEKDIINICFNSNLIGLGSFNISNICPLKVFV